MCEDEVLVSSTTRASAKREDEVLASSTRKKVII